MAATPATLPEFLFNSERFESIAYRMASGLSLKDLANFRRVCRQWSEDLNQPFFLKDPLAWAEEALFKKLLEWVKNYGSKDQEAIVLSAQGNWKELHKTMSVPKLKAIICLIDAFLPMKHQFGADEWYFEQMLKFCSTLEIPKSFALLLAAKSNHLELVKGLIDNTPVTDPRDNYGNTALHLSAINGYQQTFKLLASHATNKNPQDQDGWTPLHWSAINGHLPIAQCITAFPGVDPNPPDNDQRTPLHDAARQGHLEIFQHISSLVRDINPPDYRGWTPLHESAYYGHLDVVQFICGKIKSTQMKNNARKTPLDLAKQQNQTEVVDFLQQLANSKK